MNVSIAFSSVEAIKISYLDADRGSGLKSLQPDIPVQAHPHPSKPAFDLPCRIACGGSMPVPLQPFWLQWCEKQEGIGGKCETDRRERSELMRPIPPETVLDAGDIFVPAPEIIEWARATFINDGAELHNPDHAHLMHATLGALWTNVSNARQGRSIIGQCEHGLPPLSSWQRARFEMQLVGWFGEVPDFVLTFDARFCAEADDVTFAVLVEHELSHAGQERDPYGAPKFRKSGKPAFAIRSHDVEGFIGIAARYGAVEPGVKELMAALSKPPLFSARDVSIVCGTCEARKAA